MRKHQQFYVTSNGKLAAIWYNERQGRRYGPYNERYTRDLGDEPPIAVRSTVLRRNCDRNGINKVRYVYTEQEAIATVNARIKRNTPATNANVSDSAIVLLLRSPVKYIREYLCWLDANYPDDVNPMTARLFMVYDEYPTAKVHSLEDIEEFL